MPYLPVLAVKSAWNRRFTLSLVVVSIALSTVLLLGVDRARTSARESFSQTVSGTDLIVGARTGAIQLLLYSVFHLGDATNNVGWKSFQVIASHPDVAWAIPISLGDSHLGFPYGLIGCALAVSGCQRNKDAIRRTVRTAVSIDMAVTLLVFIFA